jgi:hypothetical protein
VTQTSDPSRLDRIEAIMLDLAAASVRHDNAIARHDQEFSRVHATLDRVAEEQRNTNAKIDANAEQIAHLTAGLAELRNLASDDIQGRSQQEQ